LRGNSAPDENFPSHKSKFLSNNIPNDTKIIVLLEPIIIYFLKKKMFVCSFFLSFLGKKFFCSLCWCGQRKMMEHAWHECRQQDKKSSKISTKYGVDEGKSFCYNLWFGKYDEWVCFLKKMCLFFCAYLIRIKKRNNFVEENFSIQAFFLGENSI
jgi:hypothetical protein